MAHRRPRRSPRSPLGALAAALALLAAACGSPDTTEAGSPLAEFLGQDLFGADGFDEAAFAEEQRQREEAIAACMADQGFEYIPRDTSAFAAAVRPDDIEFDSREYAETYGFGITTERYSQEEVGPELVGHRFAAFEEAMEDDPNADIVEAMDDGTREAYYAALYGDEDLFGDFDPETMTDEELEELESSFTFEPQGCDGEAWADNANNDFFQEFDEELTELYRAVEDDPRLQQRQDEVSECVAEEGFEFSGLDEDGYTALYTRFEEDLNRIEEMIGGFPGEDLTDEDFATMSEEELEAIFNAPREFTPEARELLGELQRQETELAVAVYDCGGSFGANEDLFREVSAEYEQRFLDEHADRLAQYRADGSDG